MIRRRSGGLVGLVVALLATGTMNANAMSNAPENQPPDAPLTVRVSSGFVRGIATEYSRQFLGIPYAQPPVGELRWAPPRKPKSWHGVREATSAGNVCPQGMGESSATDEDCLFVNVTTPRRQQPNVALPVMVWWHGGGFTGGSGDGYNAERMANQGNVIVVTVNYRLGIFGYFGLPGLRGSGNFGLADQIAALKWVKRNAAAFGGDAHNVTVFGQSAGAMAACALLTSPRAHGLVDKVAMSSGSCHVSWPTGGLFPGAQAATPYMPVDQVKADGLAVAKEFDCPEGEELECMRSQPPSELLKWHQSFANHMAYGTSLLPWNPAVALDRGMFVRVPVLSGGTRDEARSFVAGAMVYNPDLVTAETYPDLLRRAYGEDAAAVAAQYPLSDYPSAGLAWATVITDQSWSCRSQETNRQLAEHTTVYQYEFADPNAPNVNNIHVPEVPQGAAHATDLPSLFDLHGMDLLDSEAQHEMARTMIDYWTTFAWDGNPNHPGAPVWSEGADGSALRFVPGEIGRADVAARHRCAFWASLGRW